MNFRQISFFAPWMWGCASQSSTSCPFHTNSVEAKHLSRFGQAGCIVTPFSTLSSMAREFSPVLPSVPRLYMGTGDLNSVPLTLTTSSLPTEVTPQLPPLQVSVLCILLLCFVLVELQLLSKQMGKISLAQKVRKPSGVMAGAEPGYLCPGCFCSSWRCPFATQLFNIHLKLKDQNLCFHPIKHIAVGPFYQTQENNWKLNNN